MCALRVVSLVPLALVATLVSFRANAQSFNCSYAKSPDEVLICQDPQLSALDERMSRIFFQLRDTLHGSARAELEANQAAWMTARKACGGEATCIAGALGVRIGQLLARQR